MLVKGANDGANNDLVPLDNKPLHDPMMTYIHIRDKNKLADTRYLFYFTNAEKYVLFHRMGGCKLGLIWHHAFRFIHPVSTVLLCFALLWLCNRS